jgi:hypothetical protein
MSRTIDLPDDLADALAGEASRLGLSLPEYAAGLLAAARPLPTSIQNGSDLVAFWRAEGLVGSRPDLADDPDYARQLREQAQRPRS